MDTPELDDELVRLAYDVRDLVARGKLAEMQRRVDELAERRGVSGWELARDLAEIGIARGLAHPIPQAPQELIE